MKKQLLAATLVAGALVPATARAVTPVFVVNTGSGSISQFDGPPSGLQALLPNSVTANAVVNAAPSSDGKSVYGVEADGLEQRKVDNTGHLGETADASQAITGLASQGVATPIVASPGGKFLFSVANARVITIPLSATGAPQAPLAATTPAQNFTDGIAIAPDGRHLYVTDFGANVLRVYDIDAATGALSANSTLAVTGSPSGVRVRPDGATLYTGSDDAQLRRYAIAANGSLTAVGAPLPAPAGGSLTSMVIAADGSTLYATGSGSTGVSIFSLAANGTPSAAGTAGVGSGATFVSRVVALSRDGASLYEAVTNANNLRQFDVQPGGGLTPKATPTAPTDGGPIAIVTGVPGDAPSTPPGTPPDPGPGTTTGVTADELSITLSRGDLSFGALRPFEAGPLQTYATTTQATVRSTAAAASVTVLDPAAASTGYLLNAQVGPDGASTQSYWLARPLQVLVNGAPQPLTSPRQVGGAELGAAATAGQYETSFPVTFQQQIVPNEGLRTGAYKKTIAFVASATTP